MKMMMLAIMQVTWHRQVKRCLWKCLQASGDFRPPWKQPDPADKDNTNVSTPRNLILLLCLNFLL